MDFIRLGIDRVIDGDVRLNGTRFGMLTNDAARASRMPGVPSRVLLAEALNSSGSGEITRVFSPEHGIAARAADGAAVDDAVDPLTGLPIFSLYGERLRPPTEAVSDLDAVLFDVPDAGARFYTYLWSLTHLIDACADVGTRVIVLDRPNPHSGDLERAEGPFLDLDCCESFLGRLDIPITHQLTLGELALLWKAERRPEADVQVVSMAGWTRDMFAEESGLAFVAPSPALQTLEAVAFYPGLCLFEAFNVSIGRGSELSFRAIGAPWMNPDAIIEAMPRVASKDAVLEPVSFTPSIRPYAGEICKGIQFRILDRRAFRPVAFGMYLVTAVRAVHPDRFEQARYPTVANPTGENHLSLLVGDQRVASRLAAGEIVSETTSRIGDWTNPLGWRQRVDHVLLYGD